MKHKAALLQKALALGLFLGTVTAVSTISVEAEAARKKPKVAKQKPKKKAQRQVAAAPSCGPGIAVTTMYYVPHIKDFCKGTKPCASFKKVVKDAGSGTLYNGDVLRYTGKTEKLKTPGCSTAEGARGTCLTPYISVAADPRYYQMGDYIQMPALKGKLVTMPDGQVVEHPGFLIVEDVGGAIKGPNRFDFFTGGLGMRDATNAFGTKGLEDPVIVDKNACTDSKRFRRIEENTTDYLDAQEDIARFMDAIRPVSNRQLASHSRSHGAQQ